MSESNEISYLEIQEILEELWEKERQFLKSINVELDEYDRQRNA
jgi:hypothetical protein